VPGHGDVGADAAVDRPDAVEVVPGRLDRGELPGPEGAAQLERGQLVDLAHRRRLAGPPKPETTDCCQRVPPALASTRSTTAAELATSGGTVAAKGLARFSTGSS